MKFGQWFAWRRPMRPPPEESRVKTDQERLDALIDSLLDSHATPEEACSACPEMLPHVRRRWQHLNRIRAELDLLFPPASDADEPSFPSTMLYPATAGATGSNHAE